MNPNTSKRDSSSQDEILPLNQKKIKLMKPQKTIRHDETVRVIIQALHSLGFKNAVNALENESGLQLDSTHVEIFKQYILDGQWDKAEKLFQKLEIQKEDMNICMFTLRKEKFLELLQTNQPQKALLCLRNQITPIAIKSQIETVHKLASLILCRNPDLVLIRAQSLGIEGGSRHEVLEKIKKYIPTSVMLPDKRLDALFDQALDHQISKCIYHNLSSHDHSLLKDHICERSQFPGLTTHIFEEHLDEVWFISFSHNGLFLASTSKDGTAIIWDVINFKPIHILTGHEEAVSNCSWSSDDKYLLTASNDKTLKLWDTTTGKSIHTYSKHTELVSSCAWLPSGLHFVSGSVDKFIFLWTVGGEVLHVWQNIRCHDLAVSNDGKWLMAIAEKKMQKYSLKFLDNIDGGDSGTLFSGGARSPLLATFIESDPITSIFLDKDSRFCLVNLSNQEIHLWDLEANVILRKFNGHKQGRFVVRSSFGGVGGEFVLSGSDDSKIYIWHRDSQIVLSGLVGHTECVNSVSWNPRENMFASASDDHTIRIWQIENN